MKIAIPVLLLLAGAGIAAPPSEPPTDDEIRQAVERLGHEKFSERERATKLLWAAGPAAEKALRAVADSTDPEVKRRARLLLDRIAFRIEPDAPPDVIAQMQRYRNGAPEEQADVLRQLLNGSSKSHQYAIRWLGAVEPTQQARILDQFAYDDWKILVPLMADGHEEVVEKMLEAAAGAQIESIVPHYGAFFALTNRLGERIALLRPAVEKTGNAYQARLLAALYRHAHEPDGLLWAAERSGQADLVRMVMMERGQWAELLTRYTPNIGDGLNRINGLGLTAAYQRLAGKDAEFRDTLKKIEEYSNGLNANQKNQAAKALLINERTADAIALLIRLNQAQQAAELLMAQGNVAEALAISEKAAKAETGPAYLARMFHIQLLHRLGEVKTARTWLDALAKDLGDDTSMAWLDRFVDLELKLGLPEKAQRRLLERVERNDTIFLGNCLASFFPELGTHAETIWRRLRQHAPNDSAADTFKKLQQIADRKFPSDELAKLFRTPPDSSWLPANQLPRAFEDIAHVVRRFERDDLAAALLKDPNWEKAPAGARLLLADTLSAAKKWQAAADAYRAAWEHDRASPLPYFLHGWALTQLGKVDEGKAIMARSHRMILGGERVRRDFHDALNERGFSADAQQELPVRLCLSPPDRFEHGQALAQLVRQKQESGDFLAAAAIAERNLLRLLPSGQGFLSMAGYPRATSTIHALRAKGLLANGKTAEALREIERAEALHAAHLDLPILLVADLERAGEKEKAAQLFGRVYNVLNQICKDHPAGADARNQVAWLLARCRRQLDDALPHAQRAVELAPNVAPYWDTLAEVHFQRGEKEKAVEVMRKCLAMPSDRSAYFRQQLRRFEKGDPRSEPSSEG